MSPVRRRTRVTRDRALPIEVARDVAKAIRSHRSVVALETSVVAQGLPAPYGVEAARRCEAAIRAAGALPATIGLVRGEIVVGLDRGAVEELADPGRNAAKAAARDLAPLCARRAWAGTTVSATCAVAAACGIRFVATGGIGGVHRVGPGEMDVSADLPAIAQMPVCVVCSGAKAVLDVPRTVEALEALSVLVLGFRTSEFPNFYSSESGIPLEHRVDSAEDAARTLWIRFEQLGQGGALVVQPPPVGLAKTVVDDAVAKALEAREKAGVRGKAATPFLLAEVDRLTGGDSRRVNIELLEANAALAARIAVGYEGLRPR